MGKLRSSSEKKVRQLKGRISPGKVGGKKPRAPGLAGMAKGKTDKTDKAPQSAADPRPGNKPYYIVGECPCGTVLVLHDSLLPSGPRASVWHDEWECPKCRDSLWLDVPPGSMDG